ncbi:MAG: acetate--CoA ligase family protein [Planctomycetota bacterium]|nr:acetate--CoA ligase family protein [Planctomycetota bacterium]MDE2215959.1 acetate--CoA ligase family protein [Planctomycetota bacterium]
MLEHFFSPKTVAVVGASREEGKVGHDLLKNLVTYGYKGKLYPVNPHADNILGIKTYPSLREINDTIDLAVIVIPAQYVERAVDECIEKGIDSIIVISAGFKESGIDGALRERELLRKVKQHGIRMLGPNCLGLIDTQSCLNVSFAADMPPQGNIAFFSQSGALCTSILDWAMGECIGFSKFISIGNKTDIDEVDIIQALDNDAHTKVILGYLEGVKSGTAFMNAAQKTTQNKPIIIVKSGGTTAGAKAASSHTGTLAGSENAFDAACNQSGILRVKTIEELFDYAIGFSSQHLPKGPRIALITNAGGPGIIAADAVERSKLKMAALSKNTVDSLRSFLPATSNVYNPVDVLGDAKADRYRFVIEKVLKDPHVDVILVILTPQTMTEIEKTAEVIGEISNQTDKTIVTSFMGGIRIEKGIKTMCQRKVPNYPFPERAVSAIEAMYKYTLWQKKSTPSIKTFDVQKEITISIFDDARRTGRSSLSEEEARQVISAYGFKIPKSILTTSEAEAVRVAEAIGYPVVMKISSPNILHKSDFGGVIIGIKNAVDVRRCFSDITQKARRLMPEAEIKGILVQQMITGGKEVILGMSRDPQFGPLLMFGLGGIYVEVLKDVAFRIAPIDSHEAEEMVRKIRAFPLLQGVRGEVPVDIDAIVNNLLRLSQLATDCPEIMEMDINPLVVFPEGKGAMAIDARLTIS